MYWLEIGQQVSLRPVISQSGVSEFCWRCLPRSLLGKALAYYLARDIRINTAFNLIELFLVVARAAIPEFSTIPAREGCDWFAANA
jgi:hypothetical protein